MYLFQPGLKHVVHGLLAWIYTHPSYVQQFTTSPGKTFTDKKWPLKNKNDLTPTSLKTVTLILVS